MMKWEARFEPTEAKRSVNDSLRKKYSRQILFAGLGEQGQERLMTSSVVVVGCGAIGEGIVADVNPRNAEELLGGFDVIVDGIDNFETRFLVNDFAVKFGQPWIYAAAVASYGLTMTIRPGVTPCLASL